jgi:hypothetical protein
MTTKKKKPARGRPRVHWDMVAQLAYSVSLPIKDSPGLVVTFNPTVSPYLIAAETSARDLQGALASHKHQLLGPVGDIKEAMVVAEKFGEEWLKGKGFSSSDCTCSDIHPGTKLRPMRGSSKRKKA